MISGKSGLFYKLGDYAVIRDGNRDGRKMNYQKHFVLLLLGGCLSVIAGEPPMERQAPPPVAEEAVIFVADHTGEQREASGGRIVPQKAGGRSSLRQFRMLRIAGKGVLSPSRKSFATPLRRPMRQFSAYGIYFRSVLQNRELGRQAALKLLDEENVVPAHTLVPALWAALYLDSLPPDAAASRETALALAFVGKWNEAGEVAQQLLAGSPDDFGLNLFLGMLAPRKKEFFRYLEQAAAVNPVKTAMTFNWCLEHWPMEVKPEQEWDFADAWLRLILKHRDRLNEVNSDFKPVAETLRSAVLEKYYSGTAIRPEYRELEPELAELRKSLDKVCRRRPVVAEPKPENSITVKTVPAEVNLNLSKEDAVKVAETVLVGIYGKEVLRQRPWRVVESETEFQISGTLAPSSVGGVAEISIRKSDAGVARYTHGK